VGQVGGIKRAAEARSSVGCSVGWVSCKRLSSAVAIGKSRRRSRTSLLATWRWQVANCDAIESPPARLTSSQRRACVVNCGTRQLCQGKPPDTVGPYASSPRTNFGPRIGRSRAQGCEPCNNLIFLRQNLLDLNDLSLSSDHSRLYIEPSSTLG